MSSLKIRYVALGDSTGVGIGAESGGGYVERLFQRLRHEHEGVGLLNLCVSGATSAAVGAGQLVRAIAARPTLVTLGVGVNDLWRGVAPHTFEANLDGICDGLASTGAACVLCNLPDLEHSPIARRVPREIYAGRFEVFNAIIERIGRRHGFDVVDLFHRSQLLIPEHPEFFCPDGFHPSAMGYQVWADEMWPALESVAH
jgi:lysophospholipase L1-like esterase